MVGVSTNEKDPYLPVDFRINERGAWFPEPHPHRQHELFYSLHLCELEKQFRQMLRDSPGDDEFLTWLSLFGPFMGLRMEAREFLSLQQRRVEVHRNCRR
jgi:hypothetical protein